MLVQVTRCMVRCLSAHDREPLVIGRVGSYGLARTSCKWIRWIADTRQTFAMGQIV
ncbi:hypothetical protein BIWAKO_02578 [Bosea sp. BIWAKO-01]|nr:hypothetical protein BIWAKO_02578 [Bosea sp. BIWAKO-01]